MTIAQSTAPHTPFKSIADPSLPRSILYAIPPFANAISAHRSRS